MKKILLALLVLTTTNTFATQYFIQCGDNHGLRYFPANLTVAVGDTVIFKGDFLTFPFKSSLIPDEAAPFGADDGNTYLYVALLPGNYYYNCTVPSYSAARGEFVVNNSGLNFTPVVTNMATSLYVQNVNGINILHTVMTDSSAVNYTVSIFDMSGRMITSTKVNMDNSGYILPQFQNGIYIVRAIDDKNNLFATKIWQQ